MARPRTQHQHDVGSRARSGLMVLEHFVGKAFPVTRPNEILPSYTKVDAGLSKWPGGEFIGFRLTISITPRA